MGLRLGSGFIFGFRVSFGVKFILRVRVKGLYLGIRVRVNG